MRTAHTYLWRPVQITRSGALVPSTDGSVRAWSPNNATLTAYPSGAWTVASVHGQPLGHGTAPTQDEARRAAEDCARS